MPAGHLAGKTFSALSRSFCSLNSPQPQTCWTPWLLVFKEKICIYLHADYFKAGKPRKENVEIKNFKRMPFPCCVMCIHKKGGGFLLILLCRRIRKALELVAGKKKIGKQVCPITLSESSVLCLQS